MTGLLGVTIADDWSVNLVAYFAKLTSLLNEHSLSGALLVS